MSNLATVRQPAVINILGATDMTLIFISLAIVYLAIGFLLLKPYTTAAKLYGFESGFRCLTGTIFLVLWLPIVIFVLLLLFFQNRGGWI